MAPIKFIGCFLLFAAAVVRGGRIEFETIEKGSYSGIEEAGTYVFKKQSQWKKFWKKHASFMDMFNIDFKKDMVIGVFRGTQYTGGYGVTIESITETKSGKILVRSETTDPPGWAITTQALTQPYHLVKMKKTSKKVKFETIAGPEPKPPLPMFILGFDDSIVDPESIADVLTENEFVESVEILSMPLMFIYFREDTIDPCPAQKVVLDLVGSMDGFKYLEADPPEQYWGPCEGAKKKKCKDEGKKKQKFEVILPKTGEKEKYTCKQIKKKKLCKSELYSETETEGPMAKSKCKKSCGNCSKKKKKKE